ncbi:hypothetical protein PPYR_03470 [Photinus pyralis]|uniref:Peroxin-19 n=1 Tax=Photinus pyralis TaxID=7054 RepID=A0A5N4A2W6_PHOPY|nr:peroxisomal biogenesis factor 19 [Photinus pyralis]XP_031332087.1 peroxisomal biogenesis factor 19 [Photinus pyralis]XP_031332088.1 peroxisomal biogenesis factor 19 [Photinus pyralis]KAB0791670.1 hypothetical protein PPYR_03470 [Photinus pyralis]
MSKEKPTDKIKPNDGNCDEDLSDLLDSALKDFSKDEEKPTEKDDQTKTDLAETEWTDEFIRQAAEQFESNMANLLRETGGGPNISSDQVQQTFQQMAAAAAAVVSNTGEGQAGPDFTASITQALKGLTEGAENLQNPFSEADLMSMFGQQDGEQNAFVPFMQGMMQSLLSKDVLYPSLKDILSKYPSWMEANGGSLSSEERTQYEKQQELMTEICAHLEKESDNDSPEQKKVHFDTVLALMQKLQDYGQPPKELVGDLGPQIPFDAQGNPNLNQCSLM